MTMGQVCCERIHDLCDERKISLNKLSIMCGMTQSTLSNITSGRSKNPTVSTIKKSVTVWISRLWNFLIQTYSKTWIRKLNKLFVSLKKNCYGNYSCNPITAFLFTCFYFTYAFRRSAGSVLSHFTCRSSRPK